MEQNTIKEDYLKLIKIFEGKSCKESIILVKKLIEYLGLDYFIRK